jgi:recombination protein RecR
LKELLQIPQLLRCRERSGQASSLIEPGGPDGFTPYDGQYVNSFLFTCWELRAVYTRPLARLIEELQRLPGVGPKTAQRLALHILKRPDQEIQALADALVQAKQQVGHCSVCFHLSAEPVCDICRSPNRDAEVICVVADSRDVIALEKTREYRGQYHVLGGLISPMDGIGPEQLSIQPLVRRVTQQRVREVILAISPSIEGETTTLYIGQLIKPFTKVTRIAFGLPMGGDLEYADEITLAKALEGRRELD